MLRPDLLIADGALASPSSRLQEEGGERRGQRLLVGLRVDHQLVVAVADVRLLPHQAVDVLLRPRAPAVAVCADAGPEGVSSRTSETREPRCSGAQGYAAWGEKDVSHSSVWARSVHQPESWLGGHGMPACCVLPSLE